MVKTIRHLRSGISIHSLPADVFRVLTSLDTYADWNPWLKNVSGVTGQVKEGDIFSARVNLVGSFGMRLTYRLEKIRRQDTMFWREVSWFNSLCSIQREYQILTRSGGSAIYSAGIEIKGPLAPITKALCGKFIRRALKREAVALKKYCEARYPIKDSKDK